jgi:hypothetical protein
MKKFIAFILCTAVWASISFSQDLQINNPKLMKLMPTVKDQSAVIDLSNYKSLKTAGHYTKEEWRALIDSLWGPGPPTSTKLEIFDTFWNIIDQEYGGFPYLEVNWDSMKTLYRPEVEAGVSRGRFWAILGQLYLALQEVHTWIYDTGLDSSFMENGQIVYKPGIPAFFPSGWGWAGNFGAGLTPLPDSSLLVYRAITPHPLDIVPGDIVLGYDRIPWKQLYKELIAAQLPLEYWGETMYGGSPRSMTHGLLNGAGNNWGLFDTVDVVKYTTGDTLHLPTAPLTGLDWYSLFATEQVAVPGVKMPDYVNGERVTWGVVDNTSIGYIYVYSWEANVGSVFGEAVKDLVIAKKVTGLIFDFRYNIGGDPAQASFGLDYLFNENPAGASRWTSAYRSDPADHYSFAYSEPWDVSLSMKADYYDRPIAVLTGPQAWSAGDINPFRMRFHPMVRFFGFPTNGSYSWTEPWDGPLWETWYYRRSTSQLMSLVNNEGFLMHKPFPVDEEIWLTRDDVAKEEDTVVKRAVEWINNLSHAHNVSLDRTFIKSKEDTVTISAIVENPNQHPLTVLATFTNDSNLVLDSMYLYDDGLHHDGKAGDKLWANSYIYSNNTEQTVRISICTDDPVAGDKRSMMNAVQFTSIGPLVLDGIRNASTDQVVNPGDNLRFRFKLRNNGLTATARNVTSHVIPLDTCTSISTLLDYRYVDIAPGNSVEGTQSQYIRFNQNCGGQTARFALEIFSNGYFFWSDTFTIDIISGIDQGEEIAVTELNLKQNYPNPFNSNSKIQFSIPKPEQVTLEIYNLLGQRMATLVNEKLNTGTHTAYWNAASFASGVYLYRLQAGKYTETKKLVLMK